MPPTDAPTDVNTVLCVQGEHYVPGTDGDGVCPTCAAENQARLAAESAPPEPGAEQEEAEELDERGPVAGWTNVPAEPEPDDPEPDDPEPDDPEPRASVSASPAAVKRAAELGVELGAVTGTGADGMVTKADVEEAAGRA